MAIKAKITNPTMTINNNSNVIITGTIDYNIKSNIYDDIQNRYGLYEFRVSNVLFSNLSYKS